MGEVSNRSKALTALVQTVLNKVPTKKQRFAVVEACRHQPLDLFDMVVLQSLTWRCTKMRVWVRTAQNHQSFTKYYAPKCVM